MLTQSVQINGVIYAAGTAVSALPADHVELLKRRGLIKETKPKAKPIEIK